MNPILDKYWFASIYEEMQNTEGISNGVNRKFIGKYVVKIYRRNK